MTQQQLDDTIAGLRREGIHILLERRLTAPQWRAEWNDSDNAQ
jgi:hypothetical protein